MYWNEGHHGRPHFHARYAGEAASVDFHGAVIAGSLPPRALVRGRSGTTAPGRVASQLGTRSS